MEKYNIFFKNMAKLVEMGFISSKGLKKEVENALKFKVEEMLGKLNLVSREEFEVQKALIKKLEKKIDKVKYNRRYKKKFKKVKKL